MNYDIKSVNKSWSLFLDRDGVINRKIPEGYVLSVNEFEFMPGVTDALKILRGKFGNIFIVTNQQCVGKGLINMKQLEYIHSYMLKKIRDHGGDITDIFVSPWLEKDRNPDRKPGTGMAEKALTKYPGTDLSKSIMAGDSVTDMIFGRRSGMLNILIGSHQNADKSLFDYRFGSLSEFALSLQSLP